MKEVDHNLQTSRRFARREKPVQTRTHPAGFPFEQSPRKRTPSYSDREQPVVTCGGAAGETTGAGAQGKCGDGEGQLPS